MSIANNIQTSSRHGGASARRGSSMSYALWTTQVLLALTFLIAGSAKLMMSAHDLTKDIDMSVAFLRFIAVCELLGAFGLILPGLLRLHRWLTPLAASGLVIIMIGAVIVTIASMGVAPALFPLVVGLLAVFVAYGRRSWFTAS